MTLHPPERLMPFFVLGSVVCLALLLMAIGQDMRRPWKPFQAEYFRMERERLGDPSGNTARLQKGIRQILVPELGRVDRCTTCHLAADNPHYAEVAHPLRSHPPSPGHTFETFGCTVCHRGNGLATTTGAAHEGMLPNDMVTASCLACHELSSLTDQTRLQEGRSLFETHGCRGCHQLDGVGERIGPALDGVGAKYGIGWLMTHFRDPAKLSPGSGMPAVQLDEEGIRLLTTYVTGLVPPVTDPFFASRRVLPTPEAGRKIFTRRGCIGCHAMEGIGGQLGSDLTQLGDRGTETWFRLVLQQPEVALPGTVMPHPDLRPDEIDALVSYLLEAASL